MFTIKKVLNSSVVLVEDPKNTEYVLLGKGIGFGKRAGEVVQPETISQTFFPITDTKTQDFLQELQTIDPTYIDVTNQLVQMAKKVLKIEIVNPIYFSLLDHLHFAVSRYHQNMTISNKVYWEIKTYYPQEFEVGEYGVRLLNQVFHIELPVDEAANIAFHLINAQTTRNQGNSFQYAKLVREIVHLTSYSLGIDMNEKSNLYHRFITHIKFFVERYIDDTMMDSDDMNLFENVTQQYPQAMDTAYKVNEFVKKQYHKAMTTEELLYLAIHFQRLLKEQGSTSN